jgi:hypothetical protein
MENEVNCPDIRSPRVFFFEFKVGENKNIIVIEEYYLYSSSSVNKNVIKLYKIARAISRKRNLLPKEQRL